MSDRQNPGVLSSLAAERSVEALLVTLVAASRAPAGRVWLASGALRASGTPLSLVRGAVQLQTDEESPTHLEDGTPLVVTYRQNIVGTDGRVLGEVALFDVLRRTYAANQVSVLESCMGALAAVAEQAREADDALGQASAALEALEALPYPLVRLNSEARTAWTNAAARALTGSGGDRAETGVEDAFSSSTRDTLRRAFDARHPSVVRVHLRHASAVRAAHVVPFETPQGLAAWGTLRSSRIRRSPSRAVARTRRRTLSGPVQPLSASNGAMWRVLDAAGVGTLHWELRSDCVHLDEIARRAFGLGDDTYQAAASTMIESIFHADRAGLRLALGEALSTRTAVDHMFRVHTAESSDCWVRLWGRFAVDERGQPVDLNGVVRRATASERRWMVTGLAARALDASLDACVIVDAQANICFVNERASEAMGRLPRAIIGRNLWEFIPDARESAFGRAVRAALTETTPVVVTDEFPVRQRLTESRIVPIADARIVAVFFKDVTAERQTRSNLSASRQDLRDLGHRVREAQEAERRRIARELHDVMGQSLSVIKMRLQLLRKRMVKSGSSPENIALCEAVVGDTDDALQSARRLAVELRPSVLDELGLHAALQWQAQDMMAKTGLDIRVRFEAADRAAREGRRSTTGRETVVFRAVQELLTNVLKHADAKHVDITLSERDGLLSVEVRDDGKGMERQQVERPTLGLIGVWERVQALGGDVQIETRPGLGTQVRVILPATTSAPPRSDHSKTLSAPEREEK